MAKTKSLSFPVDAVYTWVDGADPVWREQKHLLRQKLFGDLNISDDADCAARVRDNDELRYALRSLALHAPWIRTVHLVTAEQKPAWLNTKVVNLVSHKDIFPEAIPLPVFSSRPIEFCVHRIPGLAEHFIYCNDDFMFGRPVFPEDFFLPNGLPIIWVAKRGKKTMERLRSRPRTDGSASHSTAVARAHAIIKEHYGLEFPYTVRHFPKAMTRSSAFSLWETFSDEVATTLLSPFRSHSDVTVTMLYPLYILAKGIGQPRVINGARHILDALSGRGIAHLGASIGDANVRSKMLAIRLFRPRTFCLNDAPDASEEDRRNFRLFLDAMFPKACRYELPEA